MSSEAVGWVFRHSPYEGATFVVHLAIADSVNDQGGYEFWMRQGACALKARVGRQKVNAAIARMVADGFLELVMERPGGANRYQFLMPAGVPPRLEMPAVKVSPQTTPTPPGGVAHDDRGVSPTTTGLSSETTGGVAVDDTEPKRTQSLPKASSSRPATGPSVLTEEEASLLIDAAITILAQDHLERRQGAPIQAIDRWMAATRKGLHHEHAANARHLIATEPGHTPTSLALALEPPTTSADNTDPLERTAQAARALQQRDRSCPDCAGSGMRLDDNGAAHPCQHDTAA